MNPLLTLLLTLTAALGLLLLERAWASRVHVVVMGALERGPHAGGRSDSGGSGSERPGGCSWAWASP